MQASTFSARLLLAAAASVLVFGLFISTAPRAHAASLTEAQVSAIVGLLTSFGVDQSTVANVTAILHGSAGSSAGGSGSSSGSTPPSTCLISSPIGHPLGRGDSGESVRQLQMALIAKGVLSSGSATGYYGPLTDASVKKLQAQAGIAASGTAGWGTLGPKTLAFLNCNGATGGTTPGYVSGSSGSVNVNGQASTNSGDGLDADFSNLNAQVGALNSDAAAMHQSVDNDGTEGN